jgi:hypothetical protein
MAQVWLAHHDLGVVDYKALTGLSLLQVPHFHTRCGASLKDLNPDTTFVSKAKCFLISRWNTRKHTNVGKPLELWGVRIIYRVRQRTHRAITTNKMDQVIVTMHASKLKTKQDGTLVEFFTLSWAVERWNLSFVSLLLSLFFKINRREYDTMVPQH